MGPGLVLAIKQTQRLFEPGTVQEKLHSLLRSQRLQSKRLRWKPQSLLPGREEQGATLGRGENRLHQLYVFYIIEDQKPLVMAYQPTDNRRLHAVLLQILHLGQLEQCRNGNQTGKNALG